MILKYLNNNFKILTASVLCVLTFGGCKKYLDVQPVSGFSPNLTFDNVYDATGAVLGVYQELTGDYGYGLSLSLYYASDNDETMGPGGSSGTGDGGKKDVTHYTVTPNTLPAVLATPFNQLYLGVERANNCIKYIPLMDQYNNGTPGDKATLRWLYAQSLTLRAQFYLDLVRIWGDVPAQFVPSADIPNLFLPKTDRDSIYDHILNDLAIAENLAPWANQVGTSSALITQGGIRGLRARIALFRGGYSLRSNILTGVMVRGSNWQTYYQIAKDECDTIIRSGVHSLNPSFQSVFQDGLCKAIIEPKEVLFQVANYGAKAYDDSKLGVYNGPKVSAGASAGSGGILILPSYFYLFDSTDNRRDVTCAPYTLNSTTSARIGGKITAIYDGKFRRDWVPAWPSTTGAQYLGESWPILRYSDVLLMYAEADNELNHGPSPLAISRFELVRTRGYGGNASLIGTTPTDYTGFFTAITKERTLEFGAEGIRKYDLIRWDSLASKIQETNTILDSLSYGSTTYVYNGYQLSNLPTTMYWKQAANGTDIQWLTSFYAPKPGSAPAGSLSPTATWIGSGISGPTGTFLPFATGFVPNKSELFPFHQSIISANPAILQNPGYF